MAVEKDPNYQDEYARAKAALHYRRTIRFYKVRRCVGAKGAVSRCDYCHIQYLLSAIEHHISARSYWAHRQMEENVKTPSCSVSPPISVYPWGSYPFWECVPTPLTID